jgi:hypothetical protein
MRFAKATGSYVPVGEMAVRLISQCLLERQSVVSRRWFFVFDVGEKGGRRTKETVAWLRGEGRADESEEDRQGVEGCKGPRG